MNLFPVKYQSSELGSFMNSQSPMWCPKCLVLFANCPELNEKSSKFSRSFFKYYYIFMYRGLHSALQAMWMLCAPAHLYMHDFNCVFVPLGKTLQNTEYPHLTPWITSPSPSVMVAVNSFCHNSGCTAVEQMQCVFDRGMFSRYLSIPLQ